MAPSEITGTVQSKADKCTTKTTARGGTRLRTLIYLS